MKNLHFILFALLSSNLIFYSCGKENITINNIDDNKVKLDSLTATEKSVIASNNNFAFELFQELIKQDTTENIFISPLSIGMALAMTFNGADGETKEQMKNTLGFEGFTDTSLNSAYQEVYNQLLNLDESVIISLANSIWYSHIYTVKTDFSNIIKDYYDGRVSPIDIADPNAKDIINNWVESKTNKKIKNLIKQINGTDVMFLVNAIYFKADWTYIFKEENTYETDFYKEDGITVKCQMMASDEISIKKKEKENYQIIELPYGNKQFGMVIILPNSDKTTNDILTALSIDDINTALSDTSKTTVLVNMPKFNIEYEILLNDVLINMGVEKAFSSEAEFPNMLQEFKDGLYISRVRHKAFIEVDEKGTEAAAATAVVITYKMAKPVITLNKPFIYLIRENHTGTVLFMGKMNNPV